MSGGADYVSWLYDGGTGSVRSSTLSPAPSTWSPAPSPANNATGPPAFPEWGYGVAATVLGQFTSTVGLLMMKRSSEKEGHKNWYRRKFFWLGFLCVLANGAGLDWIAFMFAPLSLVAPFGALTIVFSNALATLGILVEREGVPGLLSIAANLLIVIGIVLSGAYGPHDSRTHTIDEMLTDARQPRFLAFAIPSLTVVVAYLCARKCWRRMPSILKCFWCSLASASCAALSQMCLKIVAEALRLTIAGNSQFMYAGTYVSAAGISIFAPLNVRLLEEALAASTATYSITVYQSFVVITTVLAGASFFGEFSELACFRDAALFVTGILVTLSGLAVLSLDMARTRRASSDGCGGDGTPARGGADGRTPHALGDGLLRHSDQAPSVHGATRTCSSAADRLEWTAYSALRSVSSSALPIDIADGDCGAAQQTAPVSSSLPSEHSLLVPTAVGRGKHKDYSTMQHTRDGRAPSHLLGRGDALVGVGGGVGGRTAALPLSSSIPTEASDLKTVV